MLAAVLLVGGADIVLAAIARPAVVDLMFDAAQRPSPVMLCALGPATVAMMVALTLQAALIALRRQRTVTTAWVSGVVVFVPLLFMPVHPNDAALVAQLAGPVTARVVVAWGVRMAVRPADS